MKEITALNKSKIQTVIINHKLDKYDDIVFCPEKLQEANETTAIAAINITFFIFLISILINKFFYLFSYLRLQVLPVVFLIVFVVV